MAPILAMETSTPVARVAVVDSETGTLLAAAEAIAERHSSNLLRLCAEVTEKVGVSIASLEAIACGSGPGSFTGLRVGLAVAKGLAMPTGVPLVLVSSLEALALDMLAVVAPGEWLLPCLDAGKGQVYAALFQRRGDVGVTPCGDEWAVAPDAIDGNLPEAVSIVCAGPGARRYRDVLATAFGSRGRLVEVSGPSAHAIAIRALEKFRAGQWDDLAAAVPSYGRAPDITKPKRSVR
jgi:tRNA threonylcarbamoyladenosine biosynthesis protein TsaB